MARFRQNGGFGGRAGLFLGRNEAEQGRFFEKMMQ